ncbi:MAG: endonuclease/exonuclease/phosphatase family protein [Salibacteraceae bacterium]
MEAVWIILGVLFSAFSFAPMLNATHWLFKLGDYLRLQLLVALLLLLATGPVVIEHITYAHAAVFAMVLASVFYHLVTIYPYIPKQRKKEQAPPKELAALVVNVKQENNDYGKLISLVRSIKPDILLTMETNLSWERGLSDLQSIYPTIISVPKENRYGMHLYTTLPVKDQKVHFLISDEHPSIEVTLEDHFGREFIFWGIHPPPPSPTEKPTSRQLDGELMKVAELALQRRQPMIITGDFNNVCWSRTSRLFSKASKLKDGRINRGFHSTFPACCPIVRFPIDLIFHSESVFINQLKISSPIGSDHLPLFFTFGLTASSEREKKTDREVKVKMKEMIDEGEEAAKEEN